MKVKCSKFEQPEKCVKCGHPTLYVLESDWRISLCPICAMDYEMTEKPVEPVEPMPIKQPFRPAQPEILGYSFSCGHRSKRGDVSINSGHAITCPDCGQGKVVSKTYRCQKDGCGQPFEKPGSRAGIPIYCDECSKAQKTENRARAYFLRKVRRDELAEQTELKRYPYPPLDIMDYAIADGEQTLSWTFR